jgi:hypothetical protein
MVIDREDLARGGSEAIYGDDSTAGARPSFRIETAYPPIRRPFMPPAAAGTAGDADQ